MNDANQDLGVRVVLFVLSVVYGVFGNKWRAANLSSRGFEFVDTVTAANSEGAVALHMKNKLTSPKNDPGPSERPRTRQ